jgi:hypothetical protein
MTSIFQSRQPVEAEVGDIWRYNEFGTICHYLILKKYEADGYGYLYRVLQLETNRIVPDLIINSGTVMNYKATKVA